MYAGGYVVLTKRERERKRNIRKREKVEGNREKKRKRRKGKERGESRYCWQIIIVFVSYEKV